MKRYIFIALLLCWHGIVLAKISVRIDPPSVQIGDSFRLTFIIDSPQEGSIPELTPLEKHFSIIGTERSMSYSIVNGQTESRSQWTILLSPKTTGTLPIPAIRIGQQYSSATQVVVTGGKSTPIPDNDATPPEDDVLLKTEVSQKDPYVNQQVIYTVKLYNHQRLLDADYQPPRVEDALLIPLGTSRRYQTTINGNDYAVEEQQYAISPQKSGLLKITPPSFSALVYDTVPRRVSVHAKATQLNVKSIPADYSGKQWLPSRLVTLTESYDQNDTTLRQGGMLIRTITVQAVGVPAQLLPVLDFPNGSEFNSYPDKPEIKNTAKQQELIGSETIKVTYLLNKAGQITIPAVQVPWFNTVSGKEEIASLPARTVQVTAENGTPLPTVTIPTAGTKKAQSLKPIAQQPTKTKEHASNLAWWVASGFALAWVITLVLWFFRPKSPSTQVTARRALKQLQKACQNNNPNQVQDALLRFAQAQWPESGVLNLYQLTKWVHDPTLKKQIVLLSETLYSREKPNNWQANALWRAISTYRHSFATSKNKNSELPPINPE